MPRALPRAVVLAIFLCALSPAWGQTGQERAEAAGASLLGTQAPALTLKTIDGQTIDLARFYGHKAVYLKLWATWCVPCREQMPHLKEVYAKAGRDLEVIAVNANFNDPIEDVRAFQREYGLTMPIVQDDGRIAEAFHLRVTPEHVVIGRDGKVLYIGHLADERVNNALRQARTIPLKVAHTDTRSQTHITMGPRPGEMLPGISLKTSAGTTPLHDPQDRRPTALVFFAAYCESYLATSRPKRAADCRTVREQVETLSTDTRVRWIGIASGLWTTKQELDSYQTRHKVSIPLALDESGDVFRQMGVSSVPTLILADAEGRVTQRIEGASPHLPALMQALLTH